MTLNQGGVLYKDFGEIKPPGIFFLYYGILKLFGKESIYIGLKFLALFTQVFSAFFFFKSGEILFDRKKGFYLSMFFLITLSLSYRFWPPNVMLLYFFPISLSLYFLSLSLKKDSLWRYFLSGLMMGLSFLISTNLFVFYLMIPLVSWKLKKNFKDFFSASFFGGIGFLIPLFGTCVYFWLNDALTDWYWWNVKWAEIYGGAYPIWLRIWKFFYGFILTWPLFPLYVHGIVSLKKIIQGKEYQNSNKVFLILVFFILSVCSRLLLSKGEPRYYLYLVPGFIFIAFHLNTVIKIRFVYLVSFLIMGAGFLYSFYFASQDVKAVFSKEKKEAVEWIKLNSKAEDKIFVWGEGLDYYYSTGRKMATSFFSPNQHLDYPYLWEQNGYQDIDYPWKQFLEEIEKDKPVYIIDYSGIQGDFNQERQKSRKQPLKYYMNRFKNFVYKHYEKTKNIGTIPFYLDIKALKKMLRNRLLIEDELFLESVYQNKKIKPDITEKEKERIKEIFENLGYIKIWKKKNS
ncbi:MAG TPA: hypothetical protein DHW82_13085 [Spirochaetia bacterium]|nr:MAG: hypothetical protein A2Y41_11405 [Spirochaetes bacterium GWB1_36_13]HCL57924.1 hypothetical protein [Spirochaetia bacterium]